MVTFFIAKKTCRFLLLFLVIAQLNAQEESKSRIDRLRGGIIGLNLKWSGEAFSGQGSRADAMGGSISTLFPNAESISSNPAGLGFARGFSFTLDWSPPLSINPAGILGVENRINDSLTEAAKNNSPDGAVISDIVQKAEVNSELDMRGGLKGGALMYGSKVLGVGVAFHQPFRMETQLNMSGLEFLAVALDDDGDETQRIFGTVNGNLNSNIDIVSSSIGIGANIFPHLGVGMVYDNYNGDMEFESTFLPEGIIASAGGDTRAFNDPAKVQYDSLYAIMRGNWDGNGYRYRWGIGYHPTESVSLDVVYAMPFKIKLSGPFSMVYNNIRALNLGAEGDKEVFDVDKLVEDNLTHTQKKITKIPGINFEAPGFLMLGLSAKWDNYVASFTYTSFNDNLAYRLSYQQFDSLMVKKEGGQIYQGAKLLSSYRFGIGVRELILGAGVLFGETFKETIEDGDRELDIADRNSFFLPFFSLGGGIAISSNFRVDYVLSFYNSSFFRFSTTYRL